VEWSLRFCGYFFFIQFPLLLLLLLLLLPKADFVIKIIVYKKINIISKYWFVNHLKYPAALTLFKDVSLTLILWAQDPSPKYSMKSFSNLIFFCFPRYDFLPSIVTIVSVYKIQFLYPAMYIIMFNKHLPPILSVSGL